MRTQMPEIPTSQGFIPELTNAVNGGGVTVGNGAFQQAVDVLRDWQQRGLGPRAIGRLYEVNPGLVRKALSGQIKWSNRLIEAVLGEQYATVTVSFPLPSGVERKHIPPLLLSTQPPRWCPISKAWFFPLVWNQRYAPGVTGAQKRAYQRRQHSAA